MKTKVLILGTDCDSTWIVSNYLENYFQIERVIIEKKVSRVLLIKNRIKKLGYFRVFGQLCFQIFLYPLIGYIFKKRILEICKENNLNFRAHGFKDRIVFFTSLNDSDTIDFIKNLSYDIIVINGTRILNKKFLNSFNIPIINTHVGITPKYRGVHGAYWALVNNDKENCGVSVHLVDAGIDTGKVLHQATIEPTKKDNIATYHYLQIATALPLLKESVEKPHPTKDFPHIESKLYYHPTILEYLQYSLKGKF